MTAASSVRTSAPAGDRSPEHSAALTRATGLILTAQTPGCVDAEDLHRLVTESDANGWADVAMVAEYVAVLASRYDTRIDGWEHLALLLERARASGDTVWEALALALGTTDAAADPRPRLEGDRDLARATVLLEAVDGEHDMLASAYGQCASGYLTRDLWDFALVQTEAATQWLREGTHDRWRQATAMYNLAEIHVRRLCARRQSGPDDALAGLADDTRTAIRRVPLDDIPASWRSDLHIFENLVDAISPPADHPPRERADAEGAEFATFLDLATAFTTPDPTEARQWAARAVAAFDPTKDPELSLLSLTLDAELEAAERGEETAGLRLGRELARRRVRTREAAAEAMSSLIENERLAGEHARLRDEAELDTLTRVANRRGFAARVDTLAERVRGGRRAEMTLVLVDVDHFKEVNDTHGHEVGDEVLVRIASALRAEVRESDVVARWGGDEFIMLLDSDDLAMARRRCALLVRRVRTDSWDDLAPDLSVTVSVGLAVGKVTDLDGLREAADRALYRAKVAGRDGVSS